MPISNASNSTPANRRLRALLAGATLAGALALSTPVMGQDQPKDAELLRDFIHYVLIDRPDLAKSFGESLLKRVAGPVGMAPEGQGMKLADFVKLIEDSGELARFEQSAGAAVRSPDAEVIAARLLRTYNQGKLEQARDPGQIARNIALLTKDQRARLLARERLAFAGEYAMPQLLPALTRKGDPALSAEVRQLMVDMGRHAIMPLLTALPGVDPASQETIVGVVAEIPYRLSLPFVMDLWSTTKVDAVRSACEKAIAKITGAPAAPASVSDAFVNLAEGYYAEDESLTNFRGEAMQLLWAFDPSVGLISTPVDTRVFHEAMAMRLCERALRLDGGNARAVALWLTANFSRELDTPAGYENPAYPKDRRDATYYAVAAGARASQDVLARAIDARRTALARKAIASIQQTAGAALMAERAAGGGGRNALLESLRYPNRRVQYEAALALASAQPINTFDGSERVVPLLGSCIRDAAAKYAVAIANTKEREVSLANVLRGLGYTVLPGGTSLAAAEAAIAEAPGLDVIVSDLPGPSTDTLIAEVRGNARLAAVPVLALVDAKGQQDLGGKLSRDEATRLLRSGTDAAQQAESIKQLVERASGGDITAEDAAAYQSAAVAALRDLALSGNPIFNVADASAALVSSLGQSKGEQRMAIAEVMSRVGDKRLQVALMDAALAAQGEDMIALLGKVTQSAKRFGNLLDARQVKRLVDAAGSGTDAEATARAALMGALSLPNESINGLILGAK